MYLLAGASDPGGPGGAGPPLELGIYEVKFLKIGKISFFLLHRAPLGKICSVAPDNMKIEKFLRFDYRSID